MQTAVKYRKQRYQLSSMTISPAVNKPENAVKDHFSFLKARLLSLSIVLYNMSFSSYVIATIGDFSSLVPKVSNFSKNVLWSI